MELYLNETCEILNGINSFTDLFEVIKIYWGFYPEIIVICSISTLYMMYKIHKKSAKKTKIYLKKYISNNRGD